MGFFNRKLAALYQDLSNSVYFFYLTPRLPKYYLMVFNAFQKSFNYLLNIVPNLEPIFDTF